MKTFKQYVTEGSNKGRTVFTGRINKLGNFILSLTKYPRGEICEQLLSDMKAYNLISDYDMKQSVIKYPEKAPNLSILKKQVVEFIEHILKMWNKYCDAAGNDSWKYLEERQMYRDALSACESCGFILDFDLNRVIYNTEVMGNNEDI